MQKTNFKTRLLALLTAVFMVIMCVPPFLCIVSSLL